MWGPNRLFRCLDSDRCPNVLGNPEWPKNLSLQIVGRWQLAMLPRRFDVYLLHNTQFWCFWLGPEQNKIKSPTDGMILTKFEVIYHLWSFIGIACCLMISLAFWQISLTTEFPQINLDQKGSQKSLFWTQYFWGAQVKLIVSIISIQVPTRPCDVILELRRN